MNTAPTGRVGRKLYRSRTSGLVAAEDAKLPGFLAARSRKHWTELNVLNAPPGRRAHGRPLRAPEEAGLQENGPAASCKAPSAA